MFQKFMAIGNLGNDPQLRYTPQGHPVCDFSFAVNRRWKGSDGIPMESTIWFKVTTWGNLAEVVDKQLAKGRQVLVEGEITAVDAFLAKDGAPRATCVVTASKVVFLGGHTHKTGTEGDATPFPDVPTLAESDMVPF